MNGLLKKIERIQDFKCIQEFIVAHIVKATDKFKTNILLANGLNAHVKVLQTMLNCGVGHRELTFQKLYYLAAPIIGKKAEKVILNLTQLLKDMASEKPLTQQRLFKIQIGSTKFINVRKFDNCWEFLRHGIRGKAAHPKIDLRSTTMDILDNENKTIQIGTKNKNKIIRTDATGKAKHITES